MPPTYPFGYNPVRRLTLVELEARTTWSGLDAEFRRRLLALFDAAQAAGTDLGIGGGWRSSSLQEATFRQRYTSHPSAPGVQWNGFWWRLKPGMAPAAPPGMGYHESGAGVVHLPAALAADLIGDLDWAEGVAAEFGLHSFRTLKPPNNEAWHFQPTEIPNSRSRYDGSPLSRWPLPDDDEPPPPPTTEVDMIILDRKPGTPDWDAMAWTGTHLAGIRGGVDLLTAAGVQRFTVPDDDAMDRIINSGQTTNDCPPSMAKIPRLAQSWLARKAG